MCSVGFGAKSGVLNLSHLFMGSGFRVWGVGFRVQGVGVWGLV